LWNKDRGDLFERFDKGRAGLDLADNIPGLEGVDDVRDLGGFDIAKDGCECR
jgi:hypothetical protein